MRNTKSLILCTVFILMISLLLPGCSQNYVHAQDDSCQNEYHYKPVITITLGADSVYVSGLIIIPPKGVPTADLYDVRVIYMGDLDGVLALGLWDSVEEVEKMMFQRIDIFTEFIVLEFTGSNNEILGHSLSNSPIFNAITYACYTAVIEDTHIARVWHPAPGCGHTRLGASIWWHYSWEELADRFSFQ